MSGVPELQDDQAFLIGLLFRLAQHPGTAGAEDLEEDDEELVRAVLNSMA